MEEAKRFFYGFQGVDGSFCNIYQLFNISKDFHMKKIDGDISNMFMKIGYEKDPSLDITYSFNTGACLIHDVSTSDKFLFKLSYIRNLVDICEYAKEYGLGNILYKNCEIEV